MARKRVRKNAVQRDAALALAIEAVGGPTELARRIGVSVQVVSQWRKCPPRRAIAVERATGGVVRRERLCPFVFDERRAA